MIARAPALTMEDNPFVTDPHKRKYQRSGVVDDTRGDFDDNDEEQSYSEGSDDSENLSEEHAAVEDSVREEMIKLEQMFKGMGLKYRMIDRIGEGDAHQTCQAHRPTAADVLPSI